MSRIISGDVDKTKKCLNCGREFYYSHPNQRTCSPECAKARELEGAKKGGRPKKGGN